MWNLTPTADGGTRATWRYSFTCQPGWLAPDAERIGARVLGREIRRRIHAFARACADSVIVSALATVSDG